MTPAHSRPTSTVPEIVMRTGSAPGSRISTTGSDTALSLDRSRDATSHRLHSARHRKLFALHQAVRVTRRHVVRLSFDGRGLPRPCGAPLREALAIHRTGS